MNRIIAIAIFLVIASTPIFAQNEIFVTDYAKKLSDWKVKEFKGRADFLVKQSPQPMVTLATKGSNFLLAKEFRNFKMAEHPFLNFEWMVEKLPQGGDLRSRSTDDQAAGLYVTLPSFPEFINFKSIGYVWDTSAPPGNYDSKGVGNIKYVVLRSGSGIGSGSVNVSMSGSGDDLGKWHSEKRNYVEDFKKLWGVNPGKRKVVISMAADSDNTKSSSTASFGKVYFSSN
ncbi:MAG: DUF3047 domain-containing protein [Candidatus Ozemobacteraceae bacterium]